MMETVGGVGFSDRGRADGRPAVDRVSKTVSSIGEKANEPGQKARGEKAADETGQDEHLRGQKTRRA
jgi:hypothetical protein